MVPLTVVGNLSRDEIAGEPPRAGGGPFHCARALRLVAERSSIVARTGDPSLYPPDMNVKEGITYQQYLDSQQPGQQTGSNFQSPNQGTPVWGRRVVLIPIIKQSEFDNGRDSVQIFRIGAFFLTSKIGGGNGGDIQVEYIGLRTVVGAGGYDPERGPGMRELAVPVLYR